MSVYQPYNSPITFTEEHSSTHYVPDTPPSSINNSNYLLPDDPHHKRNTILEIIGAACYSYALAFIFTTKLCGLFFQCGCTWAPPMGDGAKHCNIHNPTGPHCPWCAKKYHVETLIFVNIGIPLIIWLSWMLAKFKIPKMHLAFRPLFSALLGLLYAFLTAVAFAALTGYPDFFI